MADNKRARREKRGRGDADICRCRLRDKVEVQTCRRWNAWELRDWPALSISSQAASSVAGKAPWNSAPVQVSSLHSLTGNCRCLQGPPNGHGAGKLEPHHLATYLAGALPGHGA